MIQWGRCVVWGGGKGANWGRKVVIGDGRVELALGRQFWVPWKNYPRLFKPYRSSGIEKHTPTPGLYDYSLYDVIPSAWNTFSTSAQPVNYPNPECEILWSTIHTPSPLHTTPYLHLLYHLPHLIVVCVCTSLSISLSSLLTMGFCGQKVLLLHLNILSVWHVVNTRWMLNEWLKLVSNSSWNLNEH